MADKLVFPITFDLDGGVNDVISQWDKKYAQIEKTFKAKPIKLPVSLDLRQINTALRRMGKVQINPIKDETRRNIRILAEELKGLAKALAAVEKVSNLRAGANPDAVRAARIAEINQRAQNKLNESLARQRKLIADAEAAEAKRGREVEKTNRAYSNQTTYIQRLGQRLATYFALSQIKQFLQNVRETTAQFELQRVSLGAILQDQAKANVLFSQIKQFAIKSPISIMDLTTYTKQVAAYRVEYDKLFDTTKMLADVSVGLGVDMQRLVLAFGQVKAASVLRASEVRQFTEAGIPMLDLLAQKFTELNGEVTTTEQVMQLISKRMVDFSMVEEIFKDMTSAGGMFYNMQEKQGNTLYGMVQKLGDAFSIMYDEIGNTSAVNEVMKGIINGIATLVRHWKDLVRTMSHVAIAFGAYRLYIQAAAIYTGYMTAAAKLNITAQYQMATATMYATTSTKLFSALMLKLPISTAAAAAATRVFATAINFLKAAIVKTGIGALVVGLGYLAEKFLFASSKADELKKSLDDIKNGMAFEQEVSRNNFTSLAETAIKAADGSRVQAEALDELKRTYKDILPLEALTIENLRALKGNYDDLTSSIDQYIAIQTKQRAINTATETYATKIRDAERDVKEFMTENMGMSDSMVARWLAAYKEIAADGSKTIEEAMNMAFDAIGHKLSANGMESLQLGALIKHGVDDLTESYRAYQTELNDINEIYKASANPLGEYQDRMEALKKTVEETAYDTSFIGTQKRANNTIKDVYAVLIKEMFENARLAVPEGAMHLVEELQKGHEDIISSIDFTKILEATPVRMRRYIQTIKKEYEGLIPSSEVVKTLRRRFAELVQSMTGNENAMEQYSKYIRLFSDDLQVTSESIADAIKSIEAQIAALTFVLNNGFSSPAAKADAEEKIGQLTQQRDVLQELMKILPSYNKETNKAHSSGSKPEDTRVQQQKEYLEILEKVYKRYQELQKLMGKSEAWTAVNQQFAESIKTLTQNGLQVAKTASEYKAAIGVIQKRLEQLTGDKDAKVAKNARNAVEDVKIKVGDIEFENLKEQIEKTLDNLAEEISKSKAAKEFFDKILRETGDVHFAADVTVSIFGDDGNNLFKKTVDQIRAAFKSNAPQLQEELEKTFDFTNEVIDYHKLSNLYAEYKDEILEGNRKLAAQIIKDGQEVLKKQVENWQARLAAEKSYEQKRIDIINAAAAERAEIIKSELPDDVKAQYVSQSYDKQAKDLTALSVESFRGGEDFIRVFENLDKVSKATLERMKIRLKEMIDEVKGTAAADDLKALIKAFEDIKTEQENRGDPMANAVQNVKEYIKARKDAAKAEIELNNAKAEYEAENISIQNEINLAKQQEIEAQQRLAQLKAADVQDTIAIKKAELEVNTATQNVALAMEKQNKALGKVQKAETNVTNSLDKQRESMVKMQSNLQKTAQGFKNAADFVKEIADNLGIAEDSELGNIVNGFVSGLETASTTLTTILTLTTLIESACWWMLATGAAVASFTAIFTIVSGAKARKLQKEIDAQQAKVDSLTEAYKDLEDAMSKVFGTDYLSNYNQRLNNLQQTEIAYMRMAELEAEKGKKKDESKYDEYIAKAKEARETIKGMADEISERMIGSDIGSAATSFAEAWLDAYLSFGNTMDAMKGKYKEVMRNMIIQNSLAQVTQKMLQPVFDMIDKFGEDGKFSPQEAARIADMMAEGMANADKSMLNMINAYKQAGMDVAALADTGTNEATGIERNIATASEESINGLAVGINTQNFYVAGIYEYVGQIAVFLMSRNTLAGGGTTETGEDLVTYHLSFLPTIAQNTAEIITRCERVAVACEDMAEKMGRVITPRGTASTHVVNID